jgi:hypothetical protein
MLRFPRLRRGEKPFDVADPNRPIELESFAVELARVGAHMTEDSWEREPLTHCLERLAKPAILGELDVEVSVDAERASRLAVGRTLAAAALEKTIRELAHAAAHLLAGSRSGSRAPGPRHGGGVTRP